MKTFYLFVLALTLCSCGIKKPLEAPQKEAILLSRGLTTGSKKIKKDWIPRSSRGMTKVF